MNVRNYWKIGWKLTQELKIQLVHAGVLSIIDYCDAVYGGLSESDLQKLQKLQNSAVRFVFGLKGKACQQHISPYLKKLHFLPVRGGGGGGGGGGIGYQVSDITSTKCSFGYFSLDTPTLFAVLTVFFWIIRKTPTPFAAFCGTNC